MVTVSAGRPLHHHHHHHHPTHPGRRRSALAAMAAALSPALRTPRALRGAVMVVLLLMLVGRQLRFGGLLPSLLQPAPQREASLAAGVGPPKRPVRRRRRGAGANGAARRKRQPVPRPAGAVAAAADGNRTIDRSSVAACMLMKDDNHWLIEWLAFHYYVLPLRELVFIRDPTSKTSPAHILERWRGRINITEWDGDRAVPEFKWQQYRAGKIDSTRLHRARQQFFYADCLRHFQRRGQEWVLLTDTDEFVQPNWYALDAPDRVPLAEPGSVLRTLHIQQALRQERAPTCLHIPRIQLSSRQTVQEDPRTVANNVTFASLNVSHLLTTAWQHHNGREIVQVPGYNLDGKNIVNVAALGRRDIPARVHSVHLLLPRHCPATNGGRLRHADSWLVVYHYPGTYRQYTFRDDPRDALRHRKKRWDLWHDIGGGWRNATVRDASMGDWLPGFARAVGPAEAERLLQDVGVVVSTPEAEAAAAVAEADAAAAESGGAAAAVR